MRKVAVALILLTPLACGDDDDVGDSADGWRAASQVLASGQSEFQSQIEVGVDGSVEVTCPDGGTINFEGNFNGADDFEFGIQFEGCVCHDVRMDGELSVSASVVATQTRVEVEVSYDGELTWSGAANGTCEIAMDARVEAEATGSSASAEVEIDGSICGHDAKAVARAAAELD